MSYTIVRETKFILLQDGRYLHLSLQGCNNDDEGRKRTQFTGEIYTADELQQKIQGYERSGSTGFDLKIGSRNCSIADYGKHLRLMSKRALTWERYRREYGGFGMVHMLVIQEATNDGKILSVLTPEQMEQFFVNSRRSDDFLVIDSMGKSHRSKEYKHIVKTTYDEKEVVSYMERGYTLQFFVGKRS